MNDESSSLPWDQLRHSESGVPWPALRTFADALAANRDLANDLFEAYDYAFEVQSDPPDDTGLCVPAIFALAAPRLDDAQRREIGSFLVQRLVAAGYEDADVEMEILMAAAGTLGPVVLPAVLDAIAGEPDTRGAWLYLWSLTKLVAQTDDQDLRRQVVHACVDLLDRADRGEVELDDAGHAAWTLALLGCTEYTDLLQRLNDRTGDAGWRSEYGDALKLLQNRLDFTPPKELWEEPVEKWLTPRWGEAEEETEYEPVGDDLEEDELEGDPSEEYAQLITQAFTTSPVAAGLPPELQSQARLVAHDLVAFSLRYLDKRPRDWDEAALRELLLEFVPRDTPASREQLLKIVPITEALLYWLGSQGLLDETDTLIAKVRTWSDQIVAKGSDPKNWGPVKTLLMEAREVGPEALSERRLMELFTQQLNELEEGLPAAPEPAPRAGDEPPIPIVERSSKPGRNASCPCGSGKKYKKCHGRPGAEQTSNL